MGVPLQDQDRNRLHRLATAEEAAAACGAAILETLRAKIDRDGNASLAVSGGSTPRLMFASMAKADFPWRRLHLFFVDERCVPPDHAESNYRMARETLLDLVEIGGVHRIESELAPERAAEAYRRDLKNHYSGDPKFTALHLGMGADGHTASLFPGLAAVENRHGIADAVWIKKLNAHRITLLPKAILDADRIFVLATGADKAGALNSVLRGPNATRQLPVQLVRFHGRQVDWYLDAAAAEKV